MNSGGDNPPDYNPDIINNQLITTFGTTTAPNNFAFGSVNVRPTPQQHLEHTFNTTDLTQEAIELAIDDAPGLDVHTIGINQEQIVGDGAPINESTLTIINWGKYRLRTLGLHQIATADNSNNWVVPALMEVSIPLIQNQIIDHSGTYRIVQRTIQGETGLFIEEYIPEPEPEPEEEVLENNTRAMIIDEDEEENNNNGQMVLRGQNNVRGLPDPTGEDIEGTFDINVPPPTVTSPINSNGYYKFDGNTLISGTNQDYNINVNVTTPPIEMSKYIRIKNSYQGTFSSYLELTKYTERTTKQLRSGYSYIWISCSTTDTHIRYMNKCSTATTITTYNNDWFVEKYAVEYDNESTVCFYLNNNTNTPNEIFFELKDVNDSNSNVWSTVTIYYNVLPITIV